MTTPLDGWENFYVIVGSSAGALIGLQFVVVTLIADAPARRRDPNASSAFTTPSVVHFCVVLLLSAIATIPWNGLVAPSVLWALMGLYGIVYSAIVTRRMRAQTVYDPVFEDWLFHALLPFGAYGSMAASGFAAHVHERLALFLVAGAALALLYVGIHNAWDTVTFHVFAQTREQQEVESPPGKKE